MFCTHLHIDHTGWNTMLRNGRWVPTFPKAKYIFHKGEYAHWEAMRKEAPIRPATCGPTIAGRSSRPARRCWSTTPISSTTLLAHPHARPFAAPLLRRHPLEGPARRGDGRHDASRPAVSGTGLVDDLRHRQGAGRAVPPPLPGPGGRYQHARAADPFPQPDRRPGRGATASASATPSCDSPLPISSGRRWRAA